MNRFIWNLLWVVPLVIFLTVFDPSFWWGLGIALMVGLGNLIGYCEATEKDR